MDVTLTDSVQYRTVTIELLYTLPYVLHNGLAESI